MNGDVHASGHEAQVRVHHLTKKKLMSIYAGIIKGDMANCLRPVDAGAPAMARFGDAAARHAAAK